MTAVRLSIIVPVRNEARFIRPCLESILADAPRGGIEVLVMDGMSDDGTAEIVDSIAAADPRVRLIPNPSRFVPQAMNLGIEAASGPYLGRVDGHCLVEPGYFEGCLARLEAGDDDCVGGVMIQEGRTPVGEAIAAATSSPVGVGGARFRTGGAGGEMLVDTLQYGVYRREVHERIGLFDERFVRNQDDEFNLRLTRSGGKIRLVPSLRIRYVVRDSIRKLWRQYYQYGYWKWRVLRKHGRPASVRHIAPPVFVLTMAVLLVLSPLLAWARIAGVTLILAWLAALGIEAMRQKLRRGSPWGRTVLALATLHLSYGVGMLAAIGRSALGGTGDAHAEGPTALTR